MVRRKKESKRIALKDRYRVQRRVKEHHRKLRREAKRNPHPKKFSKDPGIPNLFPFKEQLLQQISDKKKMELERRQVEKQQRLKQKSSLAQLAQLSVEASRRGEVFEQRDASLPAAADGHALSAAQRRTYFREFNKVVEASDVLIEVLDARDPVGCRCPAVERAIMSAGGQKRIILLLNKIDLVPREAVEAWLALLRRDLPTLAFKASTQKQTTRLGQSQRSFESTTNLNVSECIGADALMQLLKNYSRNQDVKKSITVGIFGYPNVGKSSVINSLKRAKVAHVGNTPGVTKVMQDVKLDSNIHLLDCPGVIFAAGTSDAEAVLRNAMKIDDLPDPVSAVALLLSRCPKEQLLRVYAIPDFASAQDFLSSICRKRGYLKKGAVPDLERAAKAVLMDWNSGKLPYYTVPPDAQSYDQIRVEYGLGVVDNVEVLSAFSKEFLVDDVFQAADSASAMVHRKPLETFVGLQSGGAGTIALDDADIDNEDANGDDSSDSDSQLSSEEGSEEEVGMQDDDGDDDL